MENEERLLAFLFGSACFWEAICIAGLVRLGCAGDHEYEE